MSGPWRHPDSGIYYFRKDTPADLKRNRKALISLGIPYKGSIHRSLATRDRKEAEQRYNVVRPRVEAMWSRWRIMLTDGPTALNHTEMASIVGETAKRFLGRFVDQPDVVPNLPPVQTPRSEKFGNETHSALKGMSPTQQVELLELLRDLTTASGSRKDQILSQIITGYAKDGSYGFLLRDIMPAFAEALGEQSGDETASVIDELHSPITEGDRAQINLMALNELAGVRNALESSSGLDFRALRELEVRLASMPAFEPKQVQETKPGSAEPVSFTSVVDEEEKRSREKKGLMAARKGKSVATISKYRRIAQEFEKYRGDGDMTTVTPAEVSLWMQKLYEAGNSRTTVRDKAAALQAITKWAQKHSSNQLFPNGLPLAGLTLPERDEVDSSERTYSLEQAQSILKASRLETKPERRWLPWLMAYSGMRVNEAATFTANDFELIEGHWFAHIRQSKTGKPRKVPLHPAVISEGILDFVKAHTGQGALFPKRTQANLHEWVNGQVLKGYQHVPPANHGWRHFFRDLCRRHRVDHEAEHYISGRAFGPEHKELALSSANFYGGSDLRLKGYAMELEKIEPILPPVRADS